MGQQEPKTRGLGGMKKEMEMKLRWGKFRMSVVCAFASMFGVPIKIREEYLFEQVYGIEVKKVSG